MELLPLEVLAKVAGFLAPRDIAMCCAVSPHWRRMFGSDEIWKPLCNPRQEEHLRNTKCVVEPAFALPQGPNSSLEPVTRWRTAFLREQHLWGNWQRANYKRDIFLEVEDKSLLCFAFISNDVLALIHHDRIELWNVSFMPPIKVGKTFLHPKINYCSLYLMKSGSSFVLTDKNFVMVAKMNSSHDSIFIKHMFFFDKPDCVPGNICTREPHGDENCELKSYKETHSTIFSDEALTVVGGSTLLGHTVSDNSANSHLIHIWDLENGVKLKEELIPIEPSVVTDKVDFKKYGSCTDVLLMVTCYMPFKLCYFVYDVRQLKFFQFRKISTLMIKNNIDDDIDDDIDNDVDDDIDDYPIGALVDSYVAFSSSGSDVVQIFNYRTSQMVYTFKVNDYTPQIHSVMNNGFLIHHQHKLTVLFPNVDVSNEIDVEGDFEYIENNFFRIITYTPDIYESLWKINGTSILKTGVGLKVDGLSLFDVTLNEACTIILLLEHTCPGEPLVLKLIHLW